MLKLPEGHDEVVANNGKYGKPDINQLFEFWQDAMGYPITVKKNDNRRFAAILLKRESLERIQEYIMLAWAARTDRYAPQVSSLIDLYYKWDRLTEWAMRKRTKNNEVIDLD